MATPTRREIEERAKEMFRDDAVSATGEVPPTPEIHELKETGYYTRARRELMKTSEGQNRTRMRNAEGVGENKEDARAMSELIEARMANTRAKMAKGPSARERISGIFGKTRSTVAGATSGARNDLGHAKREIGSAARKGAHAIAEPARKGYLQELRENNERIKREKEQKKEYGQTYQKSVNSGFKSVARREGRRRGREIAEGRLHPPRRTSIMDFAGMDTMATEGSLLSMGTMGGGGGLEVLSMSSGLSLGSGSLGESPLGFLGGGQQKTGKGKRASRRASHNDIDALLEF